MNRLARPAGRSIAAVGPRGYPAQEKANRVSASAIKSELGIFNAGLAAEQRLAGDTAREATSDEVKGLRTEVWQLKELLAKVLLENRLLKKSVIGGGASDT